MHRILNRRQFLQTAGLGAAALVTWGCPGKRLRPNFVLILVDDLGWTDAAFMGSRYYETPNLDRLAAQSMTFTDGYAACAVCSPTRAAAMTGRYPARVGVTDWIRSRFQGGGIPADKRNPTEYVGGPDKKLLCPPNPLWMELDELTIAERLKTAGYTCCHIGKWHLGADDWYPEKQGFDYNIGGCDYGQPPSYFDPYVNKRLPEGIPTLKPHRDGEYLTGREADEAVRFIRDHAGQPFFLYMAHYAVHTPIQGREDLVEKYQAKAPVAEQKNPAYAAMVESVDRAAGKIMAALDELQLAENTVVIFASDNGGLMPVTHNAPLRSGKGYPYEGGIRTPLVVRWPGRVQAGARCRTPVSSIDFFPTMCAAADLSLPTGRAIDGENLLPLLKQTGQFQREALFWHFPHYRQKTIVPYSIIRAGDWKLIKRYEGPTFELFNLKDDLGETTDLAGRLPDKVQELDGRLKVWLAEVGAKLPRPNPQYQAP